MSSYVGIAHPREASRANLREDKGKTKWTEKKPPREREREKIVEKERELLEYLRRFVLEGTFVPLFLSLNKIHFYVVFT